jgi:D-arabinose 1-dehydrogenase-like Zn-dependent alcohol dehydrogenase
MLDFCGQHGITATIEKIPIDEVNTAYERMLKSDVRYRYVMEVARLPTGTAALPSDFRSVL